MTEDDLCKKKPRSKMSLKSLRLSLKYRPELLKLILKMRQCIRRKNTLLKSLQHRLKILETDYIKVVDNITNSASKPSKEIESSENVPPKLQSVTSTKSKTYQDLSTQTSNEFENQDTISKDMDPKISKFDGAKENAGWNLQENGETEKSIAEQVKEAAQSALQDSGMVYVESAGMYYDYKTGYYYNSELGLYYHTDTGCYYCYSDDKQFVFHSYPDMSKVNASLIAHQNKKARKLKRERKPDDDIDNLTKHLSQDKEEDGSKPKKPRKSKKIKKDKVEKRKDKKSKEKKVKVKTENSLKDQQMEGMEEKVVEPEKKEKTEENDANVVPAETNPTEDETTKTENIVLPSETKSLEPSLQAKDDNSIDIFDVKDKAKSQDVGENESNKTDKLNNANETEDDQKEQIELKDKENIEKEKEVNSEIKDADSGELKKEVTQELEDGECSETESEDSESESDASTSTVSDEDSVAKHHPPCMRVIVRETKLPKLKVGSLFMITKDGGTIGREGEQHAILLKDHNVSRNHLDIRYDVVRKTYQVTDLGSKNGTILNGVRMSESQEVSLALDVLHGSTIQLGETKLLCHIHPGHSTCGQCEPGLLLQVEEEKKVAYTRTVSVKKQHELELARLKNIYAPQYLAIEEKPYNDRAQARRETVGSTNHAEKTQTTDLDTSIAPENKGFKLLQKMGWSKGEGLGKDSQGETEPVPLISNDGKAGLGTAGAVAPPSNTPKPRVVRNNLASATMRLATRTKMLQPPAKAFQNEDEEDLE